MAWLEELAGLSRKEDGAPFIDARRRLAEVLVFGAPGIRPDLARAQTYLSEEGRRDPAMLLFAAFVAEQGLGGMPDRTRALALIREAAERGNADASALLAQAEELGLGVMRDETAAINRYEKLSRFVSPAVWFRLGLMLQEGRGAKADPCRARQLLHGAAEHAAAPVQVARSYLDRTGPQMRCPRS
jgi:TPR repeat protein